MTALCSPIKMPYVIFLVVLNIEIIPPSAPSTVSIRKFVTSEKLENSRIHAPYHIQISALLYHSWSNMLTKCKDVICARLSTTAKVYNIGLWAFCPYLQLFAHSTFAWKSFLQDICIFRCQNNISCMTRYADMYLSN